MPINVHALSRSLDLEPSIGVAESSASADGRQVFWRSRIGNRLASRCQDEMQRIL
jgi:hypothetical protein